MDVASKDIIPQDTVPQGSSLINIISSDTVAPETASLDPAMPDKLSLDMLSTELLLDIFKWIPPPKELASGWGKFEAMVADVEALYNSMIDYPSLAAAFVQFTKLNSVQIFTFGSKDFASIMELHKNCRAFENILVDPNLICTDLEFFFRRHLRI